MACATLLAPDAFAAGLGKLTVLSALGQPLRAEIELTSVSAEEAGALVAKLAPADAFRVANIEFNPTLTSLRFAVDQRNGRQFIRVSSAQPVNDPFVDLLLELSWNGGRLVREYTFLLDPVDLRQPQAPQVAANAPARAAAPVAAPAATTPAPRAAESAALAPARPAAKPAEKAADKVAEKPAEKAAAKPAEKPADTAGATQYQVKSGDTLSRIARQVKPTDISLDMMLVALYRANPEAFSGDNMNRLRSGRILAVPSADAVRAGGAGADAEAKGVVVAHAADFAAYRNKLAGQVATSTPSKAPETSQSAAGKISAKVEENSTAANAAQDQLKLSKAAPGAAGKTAAAGLEEKLAKEQQAADAAARVKELEKNVNDLERLMAVKNKAMADQKNNAAAVASAAASAPAPVAAAPVPAPAPVAEAPKPKPAPLVKPVPVPNVQPTWVDVLMENITSIGLGLAVLLAGAAALVVARRKKAEKGDLSSIGREPGDEAPAMFAETGGQHVDTGNSVFNSNFAPSASQLDTNEVDPIAEADVYIAYGRDAQAEEILKEALRTHPERHVVRLKLLEIYSARKDARAFEHQASELYGMTRGQGDEWQQAASMGQALDPQNPLYSKAAAGASAADLAPAAGLAAAAALATALPAEQPDDFGHFDLDMDARPAAAPAPANSDLDFALDDGASHATALPTPVAAEPDDESLDFDLGGLSFDANANATPAAAPAAPPAAFEPVVAEAAPALPEAVPEFNMDFDLPMEPAPAVAATPAAAPEQPFDADLGMDFNLEPPAALDLPAAAPQPEAEHFAAAPLPDLDAMDFDLPSAAPAPAAAPDLAKAAPAAAPEFDLSGIDLDLDTADLASAGGVDDAQSAIHMEMDTKLDLAVAYQEIGDKEGARELIDEVLKGGSDEQVAKANSMRAALG